MTWTPSITVNIDGSPISATVVRLETDEQVFGSQMVVELDNSTGSLDSVVYGGQPISFTLSPGGGIPAGWVWTQERDSVAGKKIVRLRCVDAWTLLSTCQCNITAQLWNNPGMLDPDTGLPYTRFANYYNETISTIISTVLSQSISGTLSNPGDVPTSIKPAMAINNAYSGIREALGYTPGYLRVTGKTFTYVDPSTLSVVKAYTTDDATSVTIVGSGVTVPNRVIVIAIDPTVTNLMQEADPVKYSNTGDPAIDATSYAALNIYVDHYEFDYSGSLTSNAACKTVATAILGKFQAEKAQGLIKTVHTTSQTLLQKISGTDARGQTVTGVIYRIRRVYDRGVYTTEFTLGGAVGGYTAPNPPPAFPPGSTVPMPFPAPEWEVPPWSDILPQAVQGYMHDITFSATDWNTVAWTSGTITFYDTTTQAISSGNTGDLADSDIYYIYFDLEDASPGVLKVTTDGDYNANHISDHTGVLCVCQRASNSSYGKATFLPGWEKQPLITPDMIYMPAIQEWDDGSGNHYYKIGNTQIYGNQIKISAETYFMPGYDTTSKTKTFHTTPTTPYHVGDVWIDDTIYKYCTTARESGSFNAADWTVSDKKRIGSTYITDGKLLLSSVEQSTDAKYVSETEKSTWNSCAVVFFQDDAPTSGMKHGDLWIDTNDGYKLYKYHIVMWIPVQDTGIAQAIADAATAQGTADSKVYIFKQSSIPTSVDIGDLWLDTDDANKLYRAGSIGADEIISGEWELVRDTGIQQALDDAYGAYWYADDAYDLADGADTKASRQVVFKQDSEPSHTGLQVGDLWYHTDDPNGADWPYRWDGSSFVSCITAVDGGHIVTGAVTANKIDVANLSAISADCGTLTAGTIDGVTIYGGDGNIKLDSTSLKIAGAALVFYYNSFTTQRGYIGGYDSDLRIISTDSNSLYLGSDYNLTLTAVGNIFINPGTSSYVEVLSNLRIYSNRLIVPVVSSDPTGTNGAICYNSTLKEFRGYRNGAWRNIQT